MFLSDIVSRGSFKRQIILTFVVGFFCLATAFAIYIVESGKAGLYQENRDEATGLTQSLAVSSRSWVLAKDVIGLQEVVQAFRDYPELRYAMIISPSGRVLAHSDSARVGQFVADAQSVELINAPPAVRVINDTRTIIDIAVPITAGSQHVGWARIALSRDAISASLRKTILNVTLFVLLSTILSFLAAVLVVNRLGRRIDSLVAVAKEVQAGNFAERVPQILGNADEITGLANGLNLMLDAMVQNEKQLRSASRYTRSLIEASLDPLVTISKEGIITDVNLATEIITGRTRSELIGTDFSDYFTDPDSAREGNRQVFQKGKVVDYPLALRHRDGHVTYVLYNASIYRNEAGEVQGVFAAARDISEQQRASLLSAQLAAIVKSSGDAIIGKTTDGIITNWNKGAEKIYGYSAAEVVGKHITTLAPAALHAEIEGLLESVRNGGTVENHETDRVRKDGTMISVALTLSPIRDASGKVSGISTIARDITERKRAEEQIRQSETKYRTLIQNIQTAVVVHAPDTRILISNSQAQEILGLTNEQLAGKSAIDPDWHFFNEDGKSAPIEEYPVNRVLATRQTIRNLVMGVHCPGRESDVWVLVNADPVFGKGNELAQIIVTFIDISERVQAEQALRLERGLFVAGPSVVFKWRAQEGWPVEYVSPNVASQFGYVPEDITSGKVQYSAIVHPDDIAHVAAEVAAYSEQGVASFEQRYRIAASDGRYRWIEDFTTVIRGLDGSITHYLGYLQDITERKRAEDFTLARLRLLVFAGSHSPDELLTATLDEAELLTGSSIGFYHLVEADQKTLSLHSWSTNTIRNMCSAEGSGGHYAVDKAGVWADCVRERRPLIHNDYASLPNRKGMPEGHAPVAREVVVPIFRGERIVAIIGIGNKPSNYDESDIGILSQLGDLSWDTAERMRVEENLRQMNERFSLSTRAASLGVWDWDLQKNELLWDDRMYELYGVRREDFAGAYEAWLQGIHPDDRAASDEISKQAQRGEREYDTEFRVVWPDGSIHYLKAYGQFVRDAEGKPLRMTGVNFDITERKQADETLRREQALLNRIMVTSPVGIAVVSKGGQIIFANPQAEKILGLSKEKITQLSYNAPEWHSTAIDGGPFPDEAQPFSRVMATGQPVCDVQHAIAWPDGRRVLLSINGAPLFDAQGGIEGVAFAIEDITERKQADAMLRRNEHSLAEAQRIAHLGSWHMDLATNEVFWSEELYRIYGFDPALPPPLYTESMKLFTPESWERLSSAIARAVETGIPYKLELETVNKDGGKGWILARGELVRDEQGKAVWIRGVVMDITARKEAEVRLAASESRLRTVVETEPECIKVVDSHGHLRQMNPAGLNMIEAESLDQVAGRSVFGLIAPEYREAYAQMHERVIAGKPQKLEYVMIGLKGRPLWLETHAVPMLDGGEVVHLAVTRDITERKRAEEEIHQLNRDLEQRVAERTEQLEAANKELESFSYSVSHDLRSPLRAIDGFSHILLEDYAGTLDDEGKRMLNIVRDNTTRMGHLIDDILKFSRSGRTEINAAEIDMAKMAREVMDELQAGVAQAPNLQFEVGNLPPASGDNAMMRQVFVNLLSNALKFSRTRETPRIEVGGSIEGKELIYHVKDNGVGFDMHYADKLFGVFQRLHSMEEFEGTGIGLAIVKRIVTRHGGRVWAVSKINEGATMYFTLPQAMPQNEQRQLGETANVQ